MQKRIKPRLANHFEGMSGYLIKQRWWVIGTFIAVFVTFQIISYPLRFNGIDPYHLVEMALFLLSMLALVMTLEALLRSVAEKTRALNILKQKQNLNQQLAVLENQDEVAAYLVEYARTVSNLSSAEMWVYDQEIDRFKEAAHLVPEGEAGQTSPVLIPARSCLFCAKEKPNTLRSLTTCRLLPEGSPGIEGNGYCMPFYYSDSTAGVLSLHLPAGASLSDEQLNIFNNVGSEMAMALKLVQHRRSLSEMEIKAATDAERRNVSRDLHDNLGQNLNYLRFKLDQLTRYDELPDNEVLLVELRRMLDVANKSCDMVRSMVGDLHGATPIELGTLLLGQVRIIASRANIKISLREEGQSRRVSPQFQRQVFYIFSEGLSNIEKHAFATQVEAALIWEKNSLTIMIADDGIGFDPSQVDYSKHFGLTVIRERVEALNGHFYLDAAPNAGTKITIHLPVSSSSMPVDLQAERLPDSSNEDTDRR